MFLVKWWKNVHKLYSTLFSFSAFSRCGINETKLCDSYGARVVVEDPDGHKQVQRQLPIYFFVTIKTFPNSASQKSLERAVLLSEISGMAGLSILIFYKKLLIRNYIQGFSSGFEIFMYIWPRPRTLFLRHYFCLLRPEKRLFLILLTTCFATFRLKKLAQVHIFLDKARWRHTSGCRITKITSQST